MPPSTAKASPHQITQSYNDAYAAIMMSPHDHARAPSFPSIQSRQAANAKSKMSVKKPKRPLSGYNLFYRYKRIQILEATAHTADGSDTKAIIDTVITALPGLESVDAREHPLWTTYPEEAIQKLRASNIRAGMEGKLFPNENTRNRLHRKVHGMGFVEMGKTMREMWANIDNVTKEVFCELADVGRIRYKKLLADWKAESESDGTTVQQAASPAPSGGDSEGAKSWAKQPEVKTVHPEHPDDASTDATASLTSVNMNAMPTAAEDPLVLASHASHVPYQVQSQPTTYPTIVSPGPHPARASVAPMAASIAYPSINNHGNYQRKISCDDSLDAHGRRVDSLEPFSMANSATVGLAPPNMRRRVSDPADLIPGDRSISNGSGTTVNTPLQVVMGNRSAAADVQAMVDAAANMQAMADAAVKMQTMADAVVNTNSAAAMMGNGSRVFSSSPTTNSNASPEIDIESPIDFQQYLLKDAAMLQKSIGQNSHSNLFGMNQFVGGRYSVQNSGAVPPPPLFQPAPQSQHQINGITGPTGIGSDGLEVDNVNNMSTAVSEDEEEVSPQDFMQFIGHLDEAIDRQDYHHTLNAGEKNEGCVDQYPYAFGPDEGMDLEHHAPAAEKTNDDKECGNFSFIFGNPIHDVQMNSATSTVPMPGAYELNNNRALMA